ncbi:hypothetical protein KUCAC02_036295 [Chaenocephalus aceratus]|nr:hypothetical protein KUCAC02_036295 [Chaenocephalus aceratus]
MKTPLAALRVSADPPSSPQSLEDPPSSPQSLEDPPSSSQSLEDPPSSPQSLEDPPSSPQSLEDPLAALRVLKTVGLRKVQSGGSLRSVTESERCVVSPQGHQLRVLSRVREDPRGEGLPCRSDL